MTSPPIPSASASSDLFGSDDSDFIDTLKNAVLPGDLETNCPQLADDALNCMGPPSCTQPKLKRPRSPDKGDGEDARSSQSALPLLTNADGSSYLDTHTYGASGFGEFGEYMHRKRAKLQIQNAELDDSESRGTEKSQLFKGLSIYINGWTEPSVQDLRKLIIQHGGVYHAYLDKKALAYSLLSTHIITCSLTPAKIREFKRMKVVRPEWLVNSVRRDTLLPWQDYIFQPGLRVEKSQGGQTAQTSLQGFTAQHTKKAESSGHGNINVSPAITILTTPSTSALPSDASSESKSLAPEGLSGGPTSPRTLSKRKTKSSHVPFSTDPASPSHATRIPGYAAHKSNESAARAMADPTWRAAHTSVAPDFIEGYYKNSRLHHLSTWKAELKTLVIEAQERAERGAIPDSRFGTSSTDGGVSMRGAELVLRNPLKGKGREKAGDAEKVIMHCDFDAFFVSAGLIDRPHLKGKPVVVCHSQGAQGGASSTSEIASASYEARKFGIKNGMSLQQARTLCPAIMTIPYEFERYKQFSLKFYTILMAHADDLQAVSVDEALIEVTSTVSQMQVLHPDVEDGQGVTVDAAKELAKAIRAQVKDATGCEVSIGISHNMMMARLATRRAKPAGSYHLLQEELADFLSGLDIQDLHGFGWSTREKAQDKLGATNLGELLKRSKATLCEALGKGTGETLYKAIRGIDERKLESDKPRKSVSCEINYGIRFEDNDQAETFVFQMAEEVMRRLKNVNMKGRSLTLKIMKRDPSAPIEPPKFMGHGFCLAYNKQTPLAGPNGLATNDDKIIGSCAWKLLKSLDIPSQELRGIGIQIQKLEDASAAVPAPGQAQLPFKPKDALSRAGPSSIVPIDIPEIRVQPTSQESDIVEISTSIVDKVSANATSNLDLPSFSQVDMSVFDALPPDVRQELEAEYERRSKSASPGPPSPPPPIRVKAASNLTRITRQLAPRSKPLLSPTKRALFGFSTGPSTLRVPDKELRKLKIDPDVFAALPVDVQKEQLAQARGSLGPVRPLGPLKPPSRAGPRFWRSRSPSGYVPPPPPPRARFDARPVLRQSGEEKGKTISFTEGDDVQRLLGEWVRGFAEHPPHKKDVEYFARFLVKSVETDGGVEKAVGVMRWWCVLLRRAWGIWEYSDDAEQEDGRVTSALIGRAWWDAYTDVQRRMNEVVKQRYGGKLTF
ncbi:hypothetical protein EW146_g9508 [Bondarzewia mesenterica]|uniref:DNA repair protein REV1 n=1 Tax=Bondarzewia mesenterica TaxID=1095465 RepID=A0A4V3XCQ4_9AGAM|nr:hypothetical protein EW146_g9508 [Bondarzewia mesenterica]